MYVQIDFLIDYYPLVYTCWRLKHWQKKKKEKKEKKKKKRKCNASNGNASNALFHLYQVPIEALHVFIDWLQTKDLNLGPVP